VPKCFFAESFSLTVGKKRLRGGGIEEIESAPPRRPAREQLL